MLKNIKKLLICLFLMNITTARAEIIENKAISNQKFDIWTVSCEEDVMFQNVNCKLFTEITNGSTLFLNINNRENLVTIISKDVVPNSKMIIKVDGYQSIESEIVNDSAYSVVNLKNYDKKTLFNQLKNGNYLYFRFLSKDLSVANNKKEITVRLKLSELNKALVYLDSKLNNKINNNELIFQAKKINVNKKIENKEKAAPKKNVEAVKKETKKETVKQKTTAKQNVKTVKKETQKEIVKENVVEKDVSKEPAVKKTEPVVNQTQNNTTNNINTVK